MKVLLEPWEVKQVQDYAKKIDGDPVAMQAFLEYYFGEELSSMSFKSVCKGLKKDFADKKVRVYKLQRPLNGGNEVLAYAVDGECNACGPMQVIPVSKRKMREIFNPTGLKAFDKAFWVGQVDEKSGQLELDEPVWYEEWA